MKNDQGEWTCFNREYMPLGYNNIWHESRLPNTKDNIPIWTKYKALNELTLIKLAYGESGISRDESGKINQVWFYNDGSNPSATNKKADWDAYFEKIKLLSKFQKA
ncbi:hypothetical protein [Mongoliitalea lutea]|uniref:Uncharacterized protein n=1 Tax=Mongoliitalea lutea TaxID=849756 RepID=A0A8J3D027_9BACT|nr:hypothetical protein [Mongoliitalea lutea]GHB44517.1 hypothetical protein GCM10008106_26990 [Mongoliitalea lutea]